jgi:hypothetical protein
MGVQEASHPHDRCTAMVPLIGGGFPPHFCHSFSGYFRALIWAGTPATGTFTNVAIAFQLSSVGGMVALPNLTI